MNSPFVDYDCVILDRVAKIQAINEQYDLEHNAYISFSGGKDSTILHYLIDIALPNNNIPRLYVNTGIEYKDIRKYVEDLAKKDKRIIILNSGVNIKNMLNNYGFPFKSKQHSHNIAIYQNSGLSRCVRVYLGKDTTKNGKNGMFKCPSLFEYNFTPSFKLKCSDKCCYKLKKEPAHRWAKNNNKAITITGIRKEEGGSRSTLTCLTNNGSKFHPLLVIDKWFEDEFIKRENIKLCKLYYPPYNFKRTGCKGCPFALKLQDELDALRKYLPNEYKQCELLWKPVYDEYRRIDYRLRKQKTIFDYLEEDNENE